MKLFALSLDGRVGDWYNNVPNNSFATLETFKTAFTNRFGEKKEPRTQVASLTNIKKENETMDEFNQRFTKLSNAIPATYKPPAPSILHYYIEALSGKMQYQIRDKEPTTLLWAQEMAIKIDLNMQSSGESNIHGYSRSSTALNINKPKDKYPLSIMKDAYEKQMLEIKNKMKKEMKRNMEEAEQKHLAQLKEIQNRVITMERTQTQPAPRTFQQNQLGKESLPTMNRGLHIS